MRAIAIFLALVYHAGVPGFSGGYVGIEVFFVISGFVITGLLLREREATGHTSLRSFYGRRARRIIPAATLVIIVTVIVTYHSLGPLLAMRRRSTASGPRSFSPTSTSRPSTQITSLRRHRRRLS
jgi:peptidoglycan/LPS O-acetylase OafA/YrhL